MELKAKLRHLLRRIMERNLNKFLLLMWKNFLLQWRHPRQTFVEIVAPVFFCSLLVVVRSLVIPDVHGARFYQKFSNKMPILKMRPTLTSIAWSPQNPELEKIMTQTVQTIAKDEGVIMNFLTFKNSTQMQNYLERDRNQHVTLAGIEFDDNLAGNKKLPQIMNVSIRLPGELRIGVLIGPAASGSYVWKTHLLFPIYQIAGPRGWDMNDGAEPSYHFEGFLKLQEAVSFAIIKYFKGSTYNKSDNREDVKIFMQRFPYPKWTQDHLLKSLQTFVGLIIMLSFVYTCISTVKIITTEKEKQLKEVMKIMGLPNWLHWLAWFVKQFIIMMFTITLIVILIKARWYPGKNYTVFSESNPLVIFIFMLLFGCATITFCFAISVFFSNANTASTIAGMAWFISYFPFSFVQDRYDTLSLFDKLITSLFSNTAMAYGFQLMIMFEGIGEGLQWSNVWKSTSPDDSLTLGLLMIMLIVDTFLYLSIALYVEGVFPGEYGVPKPWNFPFTKEYWYGYRHVAPIINPSNKSIQESEFYEKEPTHLEAGIKIQHLQKIFAKNKVAVRNLNLNMYKDQITVLLGHNGAGKTTTMSMLTGMIPPSRGTAIIEGYDIRTEMAQVRDSLGLCPQHNILFDELTVKEHIYFYSRLKGLSTEEIDQEINKYINLLELEPKADALSETLSGGMKRKLQAAVALCGNSKVVMFDEPTAAMDPAARRALWDLLISQKKGRTILLSTHFMDEADLLGDRIAIMAGGKMQCCGSSFFLKKKYGTGYHLILVKAKSCNVNEVTNLFKKHIPNIQCEGNIGSELTYLLNEDQSPVFEDMLSDLEQNSAKLGVLSYGISLTTLEEVFMLVGADHGQEEKNNAFEMEDTRSVNQSIRGMSHTTLTTDNSNTNSQERLIAWSLWFNQIEAMIMKRGLSILRSWVLFLIQNVIPVLFLVLAISVARSTNMYRDLPKLKIQLKIYNSPITVLTESNSNPYAETYINYLKENNYYYIDWKNGNMTEHMFKETKDYTTTVRMRYICGATFAPDHSITAWFNNEPFHSPPLALQLVMNSILRKQVSPRHQINIYNHPLKYTLSTKLTDLAKGHSMGFQIAFNIGFSMAFVSSFYVMFYVRERVCKSKHLQLVSGVGIFAFWGSSFLCDMLTFIFTSLWLIFTLIIFQEEGFSTPAELGRTFAILFSFAFAMLPMMYLASFFFEIPSTGYTRMTLINIFTGVAGFLVVQVIGSPGLNLEHVADALHWILLIIPHYSLSTAIRDVHYLFSIHHLCAAILQNCIDIEIPHVARLPPEQCQKEICRMQPQCCSTTKNYFDWEAPGIGRNFFFTYLVGIILIVVLFLVEFRIFEKIQYKLEKPPLQSPTTAEPTKEDSDVLEEKYKINNASLEEIKRYNLVMKDVTKYYKSYLAVNRISLALGNFECFGLLGVNGAGKTTTFKMMTGDIPISSGEAWVGGYSLKTEMKKVHKVIGYCPQFDALLDDITCRETIIIFALLRGFRMANCRRIAVDLAYDFDFIRHMDKKIKQLSGGNKRKVSTAIAMIGDPIVLYLDEPTAGMDIATKRYLWNALCKIRDRGTCVVLTSHSMEECEALCTRLAIMVNGAFMCLGSTQHLKNKFSQGYTLSVKIKKIDSFARELQVTDTEPIEKFVKTNFSSAVLREKHQELLTFYIVDNTLPWSKMFGIMEKGKKDLNIEDYTVGQSSLEQVFLTFTKYQREEDD